MCTQLGTQFKPGTLPTGVSPRLVGVYSNKCPRWYVFTNAHTVTHTHACNKLLSLITGPCEPTTWTTHRDMNVYDGRSDSSSTLSACQSRCVANSVCTAIDWNSTATDKCWLHGPWSAGNQMNRSPGVDHHRLTRNRCPGK